MKQPKQIIKGELHIYEFDDGHYSFAENDVWAPGLYASVEAVIKAAKFDNPQLAGLWKRVNPDIPKSINYITIEDLETLK